MPRFERGVQSFPIFSHPSPLRWSPRHQPAGAEHSGHADAVQVESDSTSLLLAIQAAFATGTNGHPGAWGVIQNDGNFVVYDAANKPLWATNTVVVDVPNVIGQSPDAASATLAAAGLVRQIVAVREGGERPTVVEQSPMAGLLVAPGTTVDLTVEQPTGHQL
jgi:hypothetical protein